MDIEIVVDGRLLDTWDWPAVPRKNEFVEFGAKRLKVKEVSHGHSGTRPSVRLLCAVEE
jgi:hypothetical protein